MFKAKPPTQLRDFTIRWVRENFKEIPEDKLIPTVDAVFLPYVKEILKEVCWDGWWDPDSISLPNEWVHK